MEAKEYGLTKMERDRPREWRAGWCETRVAVSELNALVLRALLDAGVAAVTVAPFASLAGDGCRDGALTARGANRVARSARAALSAGLVPVLHGDAVVDSHSGVAILSGDALVVALCERLTATRAVFVTDVDGVFDRPPRTDDGCDEKDARLLSHLTVARVSRWTRLRARLARRPQPPLTLAPSSEQLTLGESHDATGGMVAKLDAALHCAASGAPVHIVSHTHFKAALLHGATRDPPRSTKIALQ